MQMSMKFGSESMRRPVEIEFACNINNDRTCEFYLLQIRPIVDPSVMLPGSSLILTRIAPVRNYIGKFFRETPLLTYMLWC